MGLWSRLREALRGVIRRRDEDREMREEMAFHIESDTASRIRGGQNPDAARREAMLSFGAVDRFEEEVRDARGVRWLEDGLSDVRFGARSLRRTPGASAAAVLTLALGIGATTAIFSVVKGVLLDPLPYGEPDRLISVWSRFEPESGFDFPVFVLSPPEYFDYRAQNRSMEDVAVVSGTGATVVPQDGAAIRVQAAGVTANTFGVLGVAPLLGRTFTEAEDGPGGSQVAVLSYALWQSAFGGAEDVVGRELRVNGRAMEVVGVMPADFSFPGDGVQLWAPLGLDPSVRTNRQSHFLRAIARIRRDVTLASASAEMETLMAAWKAEYPDIHTGHYLWLRPLEEDVVGNVRATLWLLLGAVGLVMLIVCANVANLLLARGAARQTELAVRATLGAGRRRIVQQLLTESGLLAAAGAAIGIALAWVGLRSILLNSTSALPRLANIELDAPVLFFTAVISLGATLLAGVAPAWRASMADPQSSIREGARSVTAGRRSGRLRSGLVVVEVALAVLLVTAAGLMIRSFQTLNAVEPGFEPGGALMADISFPSGDYGDEHVLAAEEDLLERITAVPGVRTAGITTSLPLFETPGNYDFDIENRPPPAPGQPATSGDFIAASPGLLESLDVALLQGRWFEPSDRLGSLLVAVVNRTAARMFWPGQDPIGKRIRMSRSSGDPLPWLTIVGVIDDVKYASLAGDFRPAWYAPVAQMADVQGSPVRSITYVLRTSDTGGAATAVRRIVAGFDPNLPIGALNTVDGVLHQSLAGPRFLLTLLSLFAALALLLGSIGLYGVLSYTVTERARELGIRMALGARRIGLLGHVAWRGLSLALVGLAIGIPAALFSSRLMQGMLFETSPTDAPTFAGVAITMLFVAGIAALIPAWRAIRMDPVKVLRA